MIFLFWVTGNRRFTSVSYFCAMKTMKKLAIGCLYLLIVALASATIVETYQGTAFVKQYFYSSLPFAFLWAIVAVSILLFLINRKVAKRPAAFMIHLAILVILGGALLTRLTGQHGHLQLSPGQPQSSFQTEKNAERLPFSVTLTDFQIRYYSGTRAPLDFVSQIRINHGMTTTSGEVSMNRIFKYRGYRFYQAGYDNNGGVTLRIAHDPYGIGLTYAGYALLLLSFFLFFADPHSRFRHLLKRPELKRNTLITGMLLALGTLHAMPQAPRALPKAIADQFGDLYVCYNNRICPVQSLAKDFTLKLYGKTNYRSYTAEQVLTGWMFYPSDWKETSLIKIKKGAAREILGITGKYARWEDFTNTHNGYKLDSAMRRIHEGHKVADKSAFIAADEKYNLIAMLFSGTMLHLYPIRNADNEVEWFARTDVLPDNVCDEEWLFVKKTQSYICELAVNEDYDELSEVLAKIKQYQIKNAGDSLPKSIVIQAEKSYNKLIHTRLIAIIGMVFGLLLFAYYSMSIARQRTVAPLVRLAAFIGAIALAAYLSLIMALRWIAGQHVPLSNGFETMQFMAWCAVLLALALRHRFGMILPSGVLVSALAMMVSMMGEANPRITQLVPVLSSPLLSIHVAVLMFAYSLLAFIMLNGIAAILIHARNKDNLPQIERLKTISQILFYPAVFALAIGIIVGAIWANVSWGTYWSWDPKEVWALITLMVYTLALHEDALPALRKPMPFHWFSVLAFLSVAFTYFGVNFLLGGLHAYV